MTNGSPPKKRRWLLWVAVVIILLLPIPRSDGIWLPVLFHFFDYLNNFLPSNF